MQPQPPAAPPPQRRRLSTGAIVAIVIGAVIISCIGGCVALGGLGALTARATPNGAERVPPPPATGKAHTIRFEVTGAGQATRVDWSISYDSSINRDVTLPWSKQVTTDPARTVGLASVTVTKDKGPVKCRLLIDGKVVEEHESEIVVQCATTVDF